MMTPFPAAHELLQLFETEPTVVDVGVPWVYNTLTFTLVRGNDRITCKIVPGYGELALGWERDGEQLVALELADVKGLLCHLTKASDALIVQMGDPARGELCIRTRPRISLNWTSQRP